MQLPALARTAHGLSRLLQLEPSWADLRQGIAGISVRLVPTSGGKEAEAGRCRCCLMHAVARQSPSLL